MLSIISKATGQAIILAPGFHITKEYFETIDKYVIAFWWPQAKSHFAYDNIIHRDNDMKAIYELLKKEHGILHLSDIPINWEKFYKEIMGARF